MFTQSTTKLYNKLHLVSRLLLTFAKAAMIHQVNGGVLEEHGHGLFNPTRATTRSTCNKPNVSSCPWPTSEFPKVNGELAIRIPGIKVIEWNGEVG